MIDETENLNQSLLNIDLSATSTNTNFTMFVAEERFEPCRVCGEPSSGWHCGAVTCEACKKFFLRSINGEDAKYKCVRNKDCVIARQTRTQCQYCRYKKCKEVGMTINENPNNPTVAELFKAFPCSVCKAASSGVHFGAITCEGCKGFFRRSIKERAPAKYKCMDNGACEISIATRNMCRYCRFQKCKAAGMCSENSRIGRQSNLFKHQIIELQRRGYIPNSEYLTNAQRKTKSYKAKNEALYNGDDYSFMNPQDQSIYNNNNNNNNNNTNNMNYNMYTNQQQDPKPLNTLNYDNTGYSQQTIQSTDLIGDYYYTTNTNSNATTINDTTSNIVAHSNLYQNDISQTQHITPLTYHPQLETLFDKHTTEHLKTIIKYFTEFKNDFIISINDPNYAISSFNYENDYDFILETMRLNSVKFLKFAENLPEMALLSIDDQNELIKNSIHSVVILILINNCNFLNYFNCDEITFQKIVKLFPIFTHATDYMRRFRDSLNNFKLDDIEYALYATVLVISPAGINITQADNVYKMKEHLSECLNKYMLARRNEEHVYDELFLMNPQFRKLNKLLKEGILDAYQRLTCKEPKVLRSYTYFSRVYLPKNVTF